MHGAIAKMTLRLEVIGALTFAAIGGIVALSENAKAEVADGFQKDFKLEGRTFAASGENKFFILKPGFQLTLENKKDKLQITVLDETRQIGAVTARVVEEREWEDGEIIEVSRNFFAIDKDTSDIFYFGEEVDEYKHGKIAGHSGAWRADETDSKAGMMMPAEPKVGQKFYQEIAPGKALDRAEVLSLSEKFKTPAGTFDGCLKTAETSGLNPAEKETKFYAPGVGIIQDGKLKLTKSGYIKAN